MFIEFRLKFECPAEPTFIANQPSPKTKRLYRFHTHQWRSLATEKQPNQFNGIQYKWEQTSCFNSNLDTQVVFWGVCRLGLTCGRSKWWSMRELRLLYHALHLSCKFLSLEASWERSLQKQSNCSTSEQTPGPSYPSSIKLATPTLLVSLRNLVVKPLYLPSVVDSSEKCSTRLRRLGWVAALRDGRSCTSKKVI